MLKLKYLFENYPLVKLALRHWKHDEDGLDEIIKNFRISSNAIYPFKQNGKINFLRLAPTDEKLEKNIFGEIEFILYLKENNYSALTPVKADNGEYVLKLETKWGTYYASVFEKVAGTPIEDTDYFDEIMFEYGKALGRLHALSSKFIPKTKKWDHNEALVWIYNSLQKYNAPQYAFDELEALKKDLVLLPNDNKHYGLIHYDFEPDNVFYDSATKTCNVIDFDDGMYHYYALDIEQVFDSLAGELNENQLKQAEKEFIRGYQTEFYYSDEILNFLPTMRRFCNLFSYARLIRCVDEKFDNEPEWLIEIRKTLNGKINYLKKTMQNK